MNGGRDLLLVLMVAAIPWVGARRWHEAVGPPARAPPCPVAVEVAGAGVGCVGVAEATRARVRNGDRLRLEGERVVWERMAPARLAVWAVAVDVNRASSEELASLDSIGPKLAERIVAARPFATVDEVGRVRGIGRRRLERLRYRLVLDE
jgi:competence ComEA-like helix-hairpin-helix protein